ncbi:condensation domain-containing protein [Streptomyces triticiradicis]|uniref:Condensation domain-containing protein n=1 Tax=Streptomyces triticiradicis TaxID=2651189 RepID=A0A7J5DPQ5_9ACTN|nr:condensation domain-containing protein [Streptomyces triticiradicis]KAB1990753.1 hypothetical protein F8144_02200 [Streptomyces triticiradicis]
MTGTTLAPLSPQQDEMVRNLLDYPECVDRYDFVCLFRLDGPVDRAALAGALEDVVRRHAALRTVIRRHGDGYLQEIHPEPLVALDESRADGDLAALTDALAAGRHGADAVLSGAPLFRPGLHVLSGGVFLSLTIHHMVYDGWSLSALWRELSECYTARVEKRSARLPELDWSYADFAAEQRALVSTLLPEAVTFWREAAEGFSSQVPWPAPTASAGEPPLVLGHVPLRVPDHATAALRSAARQARVSPSAVLLGATAAAVARTTGWRSQLIGTDTAGREDRRKRHLVGHCVNSRFTAVTVEPGVPLVELARRVWDQWAAAEKYRDVYSDLILQELGLSRLFKVNLNSGRVTAQDVPALPGVGVTPVPVPVVIRDWRPLHVVWNVTPAQIDARLNYQRAGVDRSVADAFGRHALTVLENPLDAI